MKYRRNIINYFYIVFFFKVLKDFIQSPRMASRYSLLNKKRIK